MKDDIALGRTKSPGNPTQDINWDYKWPVSADGSETGEKESTEKGKKNVPALLPLVKIPHLHNSMIP